MTEEQIRYEARLRSQQQQIMQFSIAVSELEGTVAVLQAQIAALSKPAPDGAPQGEEP
jgi:uncharacterized coiled-coil protein SlyX